VKGPKTSLQLIYLSISWFIAPFFKEETVKNRISNWQAIPNSLCWWALNWQYLQDYYAAVQEGSGNEMARLEEFYW